jgi:hypothetical protein
MPTFTFSLTAAAPGGRRYASAVLRDSSRYKVLHPTDNTRNSVYRSRPSPPTSPSPRPSSPFYLCTDPSSPATFEPFLDRGLGEVVRQGYISGAEQLVQVKPSFVFSPKFSRTLVRNGIVVPARYLFPFHPIPQAESECSASLSTTLSSDISQWTEIKDPFARERGNTHTSDIDSVDFSVSSSGLTLYSGSPSEYNESDFEGSHSSDLVPVLSPCVRLSFSLVRSGFSPLPVAAGVLHSSRSALPAFFAPSVLCSPSSAFPPSPSPVAKVFPSTPSPPQVRSCSSSPPVATSLPVASVPSFPSVSSPGVLATLGLVRPPPVSFRSRRPRGRFYNPRYDPGHPLFEPHLLLPRSAAASLSPSLDQDDNSLLELDPSSPLGTNLYSTFPVPGEWPDFDSSPEPASGPVGWLKALTSPAV